MELNDRKMIAQHLREAINREDLSTREAARFLNIAPYYISMGVNEKLWDSMSKSARERIETWHQSREKISAFLIPEGEEICKEKEKKVAEKPAEEATPQQKIAEKLNVPAQKVYKNPEEKSAQLGTTETQRLKVILDIDINLSVNGQKVQLR